MQESILSELQTIKGLLLEIQDSKKEVLNFKEACKFLGFSGSYLYKLTSTNQIPHFKPQGKMVYFNRSELETWLQQNRIRTSEEIEQAAIDYVSLGRKGKQHGN
jgi:excisionase family DNA binding protein